MSRIILFSAVCCVLLLTAMDLRAAEDLPATIFGPRMALYPVQPDGLKIAVFPVQNLSGKPAPVKEIARELAVEAERIGAQLVADSDLEAFIERHWVRQVGYIDSKTAALLNRETGADAALITSIEMYQTEGMPSFALIARLVALGEVPRIIWMESASLIGDESPGLLNLGIITDEKILRGKVMRRIADSLQQFLLNPPVRRQLPLASKLREQQQFTLQDLIDRMKSPRPLWADPEAGKQGKEAQEIIGQFHTGGIRLLSRHAPVSWYGSAKISDDIRRIVAVVTPINYSTRKNASELLELHIAKHFVNEGSFNVLELGVVRDTMLASHIIMDEGISAPAIDTISFTLNVDMIVNGKVFDYTESTGVSATPVVDFSLQMFERDTRRILWSSHSRNKGDDGVFFYDWGRINTAASLVDRMTRVLVDKFIAIATGK